MSDELHVSLEDRLAQMGISKILIDELVSVAVRVNYGQVKHFLINLCKKILHSTSKYNWHVPHLIINHF